ncbi:ARID DNA-binding domain-containing protein [Tanacetum coccineum]
MKDGGTACHLTVWEARALLGRLEYQRGNVKSAFRVFDGIDVQAPIQRLQSISTEKIPKKACSHTDSEHAAEECKKVLDGVEKIFPHGIPDAFVDTRLQETISRVFELLPQLWAEAGHYEETVSSYRLVLNQTPILANQLEEVIPGVIHRVDLWKTLALCCSGIGQSKPALDFEDGLLAAEGIELLALIISTQQRFSEAEVVTDAALDETVKWDQGPLLRLKAKLRIAQSRHLDAIDTYRHLLALVQAQKKSYGPLHSTHQVMGSNLTSYTFEGGRDGRKWSGVSLVRPHTSESMTCPSQIEDERVNEYEVWQGLADLYSYLARWKDAEICLGKAREIVECSSRDSPILEEPWERPIHKHDQVVHTRRYLHRETPKRLFTWNSRKKSLSPKSKKIMWKKLKEVEAFNASKLSTKVKDHGERSARTLKEKRARCYICKIRGHVFWKCPNKKREAMIEQQKKLVKPTVKKIEERVKYPEKVHIITVLTCRKCTDLKQSWDRNQFSYCKVSAYKQHMCPTKTLFKNLKHKFKMVGKEETERKFIFSYGAGEVTVDTRDRNLVIPCVLYTPETTLNVLSIDQLEDQGYIVKYNNNKCSLHYMFDEARTRKNTDEETKKK